MKPLRVLKATLDSQCCTRLVIIIVRDAINDSSVLIIVFNVSNTKSPFGRYLCPLEGFRNDLGVERDRLPIEENDQL